MSRRKSREEAFKILFAREASGTYEPDSCNDFTRELVQGVMDKQSVIDEELSGYLRDWRIERVHPVERILLRMGAYEILYTETSKAVVINELVEIAKQYGDKSTPSFVNGILDNFQKPSPEELES